MRKLKTATAFLALVLVGCGAEAPGTPREQKSVATPQPTQTKPPEPKPMLPVFAQAEECLVQCKSLWYSTLPGSDDTARSFEMQPELPIPFSEFVSSDEEMSRFVSLVDKFPLRFHSIGKLGPEDEEKTVSSSFGTYTHTKPKLFGRLSNVVVDKNRVVYIYSDVYYMRIKDKVSGNLHVAIDPKTKEYAGVIRSGSSLDGYAQAGVESLLGTLLAHTVVDDLETASMLAHYARSEPGQCKNQPVSLPLGKSSVGAALEHLRVLNERLGTRTEVTGVPPPSVLQRANIVQAASAWFAVSQGNDRCILAATSPEDRISLIKSTGIVPRVREVNEGSSPVVVEVSADDGRYETTWRYFKSKDRCEQSISSLAKGSAPK